MPHNILFTNNLKDMELKNLTKLTKKEREFIERVIEEGSEGLNFSIEEFDQDIHFEIEFWIKTQTNYVGEWLDAVRETTVSGVKIKRLSFDPENGMLLCESDIDW